MSLPGVGLPPDLVRVLREARRVVALTGSGISAESGVPTFRDARTGLWARYDPQELATPEAFARDPRLVWEWYEWRRELVARAQPNAGHRALVELQERFESFTLVTQNVDGLHQRAGSASVIELHGNINRTVCSRERTVVAEHAGDEKPPRCPSCGAYLRPDVVWFGEMLPAGAIEAASDASRCCDLFLSVGTSGLVYPAAGLPYAAAEGGAMVVEINPDRTPLSSGAHFAPRGTAGAVLPELVKAVSAA